MRRRLLLVGGGHAHLRVLRELARRPPNADVTLVSPDERQLYSGMFPGYLSGMYDRDALTIPLAPLARAAGAIFLQGRAEHIDAGRRVVHVDGSPLDFDLLSLDVGSVPSGLDVPGVGEHAESLRPWPRALELRDRLDTLSRDARSRVLVVGAGAGGVEIALAVDRRIGGRGASGRVTLVEKGAEILPGFASSFRARVRRLLEQRGIALRTNVEIAEVDAHGAVLAAGERIASALTIWVTGAAPPPLLATSSDVPLDASGYLEVDATLRATNGAPIWGAGDCIALAHAPDTPKAGVYAVREAPILATNLRAALGEGRARRFDPQRHFLALLNTSDGRALLRWRGFHAHGRWAWHLKDRIDRRFVEAHRR